MIIVKTEYLSGPNSGTLFLLPRVLQTEFHIMLVGYNHYFCFDEIKK